jgi:hypothetical protein
MKINLRALFLDGNSKEITCSASDLVKFEDKFNISVSRIQEEVRITHLLFLAWASEVRTKSTALDFEAWTETVESVGASELDPK